MQSLQLSSSIVLGISFSAERLQVDGRYRMIPEPRTEKAPISQVRRIEPVSSQVVTKKTLVGILGRQTLIGIPAPAFYR